MQKFMEDLKNLVEYNCLNLKQKILMNIQVGVTCTDKPDTVDFVMIYSPHCERLVVVEITTHHF